MRVVDYEPTAEQIILSAVGNALASGLPAPVLLQALNMGETPWEIDAAVTAAINLNDITKETAT